RSRRLIPARWLTTSLLVLLTVAGAMVGYRLVESKITADIYRDRLVTLSEDYETLRRTYNEAVRRTAVTELLVEGDTVCVVIRTAAGVLRKIATPYSPDSEVYVDYVVVDGRLWIRRVFDAHTPPEQG